MYVVDSIDKYFWQTYSALYPILCEKGAFDKMRALYMGMWSDEQPSTYLSARSDEISSTL